MEKNNKIKCPFDNKEFPVKAKDLPINYQILSSLPDPSKAQTSGGNVGGSSAAPQGMAP